MADAWIERIVGFYEQRSPAGRNELSQRSLFAVILSSFHLRHMDPLNTKGCLLEAVFAGRLVGSVSHLGELSGITAGGVFPVERPALALNTLNEGTPSAELDLEFTDRRCPLPLKPVLSGSRVSIIPT